MFGTAETAAPVVRTLQGVFRHVELFGDVFSATNVPAGNFVAFASDAPLRWRARTEEDFGGSDVRKAALADFEARRIPLDRASPTHADEESDDEEYRMWELSRQAAAAHARIVEDVWGKDLWRRC